MTGCTGRLLTYLARADVSRLLHFEYIPCPPLEIVLCKMLMLCNELRRYSPRVHLDGSIGWSAPGFRVGCTCWYRRVTRVLRLWRPSRSSLSQRLSHSLLFGLLCGVLGWIKLRIMHPARACNPHLARGRAALVALWRRESTL